MWVFVGHEMSYYNYNETWFIAQDFWIRWGDHDVARRKGAYGITYYPLGLQIWEVKFFIVVQGTF